MQTEGTRHDHFDTRWCPRCRKGFNYTEAMSHSPPYGWTNWLVCFRCMKGYMVRYRSGWNTDALQGYYVIEEEITEKDIRVMRKTLEREGE